MGSGSMKAKAIPTNDEEFVYQHDDLEETFTVSSHTHSYFTMFAPRLPRGRAVYNGQTHLVGHRLDENYIMLPTPMKSSPLNAELLRATNERMIAAKMDKVEMRSYETMKEETLVKMATMAIEEYFENYSGIAFRLNASLEREELSVQMSPVELIRDNYDALSFKTLRKHFEEQPLKKKTMGSNTMTWKSGCSRGTSL